MALTDEQIKEALASDVVKSAIKEAVDKEVDGLKNKRDELLGSMKDLKAKLKEIEDERDDAAAKAAAKSGDVEQVKKQLEEKFEKEKKALIEENTGLKGQLETHVIGEGLTQALVKAKVQPALMDAAKALIKSSFKGEIGNNDGKPFAKFDGKAVEDFVTGWAQTESGKHFVSADNNSGGGSNGANGNGKAAPAGKKTMTRIEFEALPADQRTKASIEGVKLTD